MCAEHIPKMRSVWYAIADFAGGRNKRQRREPTCEEVPSLCLQSDRELGMVIICYFTEHTTELFASDVQILFLRFVCYIINNSLIGLRYGICGKNSIFVQTADMRLVE